MSKPSLSSTQYRPETINTAVERVVEFGRKLLVYAPNQLISIVERQARQMLIQQPELDRYKQQLQALQGEVADLQDTQFTGSVAPFRIDEKSRPKHPKSQVAGPDIGVHGGNHPHLQRAMNTSKSPYSCVQTADTTWRSDIREQ